VFVRPYFVDTVAEKLHNRHQSVSQNRYNERMSNTTTSTFNTVHMIDPPAPRLRFDPTRNDVHVIIEPGVNQRITLTFRDLAHAAEWLRSVADHADSFRDMPALVDGIRQVTP
jgi:hypothetical protein